MDAEEFRTTEKGQQFINSMAVFYAPNCCEDCNKDGAKMLAENMSWCYPSLEVFSN